MSLAATPAHDPACDLRARIGWLCHGLRLAVVLWCVCTLAVIVWHWRSPAVVAAGYGGWWKIDLSALPVAHYALGLAVLLLDWALIAVLCVTLWRMFGLYLQGEVFSRAASQTMRRAGQIALVVILFDTLARPAISAILTMHLPPGARHLHMAVRTEDLLHLFVAGLFLALARIFEAASDMAEDQAGIV